MHGPLNVKMTMRYDRRASLKNRTKGTKSKNKKIVSVKKFPEFCWNPKFNYCVLVSVINFLHGFNKRLTVEMTFVGKCST